MLATSCRLHLCQCKVVDLKQKLVVAAFSLNIILTRMYPNKFHETIIVHIVLYGCETNPMRRTPIKYGVNKILRKISVPKTEEIRQGTSLLFTTYRDELKQAEKTGTCRMHRGGVICSHFGENLEGKRLFGDPGVDETLKKYCMKM